MTTPTIVADETADPALDSAGLQGLLLPGSVLVLLIVHAPSLNASAWAPRLGLTMLLAAAGLPLLPRLLRSEARLTAVAGSALLVCAVIAAVLADRPLLSFLPTYNGAASVVLIGVIVGAWAIGSGLHPTTTRRLAVALLVGAGVNVLVGVLQVTADLRPYRLDAPFGAQGLLGNPVHFGALLAGTVALVVDRCRTSLAWMAGLVGVGAALSLSGSRMGAGAALLVAVVTGRSLRARAALVILALVVGFAGAEVVARSASLDATTTVAKVASTSSIQTEQRVSAWSAAIDVVVDEPLGVGPGRFAVASLPRTTLSMARAAPDVIYTDAHNLFFEYLATVGPLGAICLVAFLALAIRRSRGSWRWFGIGLLLVYLVQPQSLATVPLAFLALGAGSAARFEPGPMLARVATVSVATALAVTVVVGDFLLREADLGFVRSTGQSADDVLFPWPESASQLGQILVFHGATGGRSPAKDLILDDAEVALTEAADRDPVISTHWNNLADVQLFRGELDRAASSFERAVEANPWTMRGLVGSAAVAYLEGDDDRGDEFAARARRIDAVAADRAIRERVGELAPDDEEGRP